ncbi:MAG: hypothetical protein QY306_14920 [Anaerolineales bacterium]|nr:MAG: hypothetical protein QY306_14920 [Anaerolineales bacterium]
MKTIFKIIAILVVASIVAGGFYLAVNNTSLATESSERGEPSALTNSDGQSFQPMGRSEGSEGGTSLARGLGGVMMTIVKLAVITVIVLAIQKAFNLLGNRKMRLTLQETE